MKFYSRKGKMILTKPIHQNLQKKSILGNIPFLKFPKIKPAEKFQFANGLVKLNLEMGERIVIDSNCLIAGFGAKSIDTQVITVASFFESSKRKLAGGSFFLKEVCFVSLSNPVFL